MKRARNMPASGGFSMIELLLSISILAIMSAMVMAFFSNTSGMSQAKDQRNAQSLCTLYTVAEAAGAQLAPEGATKSDILRALKQGVTVQTGTFRGRTFALPNIDESELDAAGRYLELRNGRLIYQSGGAPQGG